MAGTEAVTIVAIANKILAAKRKLFGRNSGCGLGRSVARFPGGGLQVDSISAILQFGMMGTLAVDWRSTHLEIRRLKQLSEEIAKAGIPALGWPGFSLPESRRWPLSQGNDVIQILSGNRRPKKVIGLGHGGQRYLGSRG